MKSNVLTRSGLIIRCFAAFFYCSVLIAEALAHDIPVHEQITLNATASAGESASGSGYRQFLSLNAPQGWAEPILSDGGTPMTPEQWMVFGSAQEDNADTDAGGKRSYNHFYDPLNNLGLSDFPPDTHVQMGQPSFTWASVSNGLGFGFTNFQLKATWNTNTVNNWSWQNARQYQLQGLTNSSLTVRQTNLARMYRAVGQVIHLLEDTSQPQHVRNEQHLDKYQKYVKIWISPIEQYGLKHVAALNYQHGMLDWRAAGFTKMRDFWDRDFYVSNSPASSQPLTDGEDTNQPTKKLGLAEFANGNFIGDRHIYAEQMASNSPFWYPFPSLLQGTDWSALTNDPAHNGKTTTIPFVGGGARLIVAKTNQGRAVLHHGAVTVLEFDTDGHPFPGTLAFTTATVDDPDVLQDYHDTLIPEAIKYSAGLIDYYFRGTLGVGLTNYSDTTAGFRITNTSSQDFKSGAFRLFYDNAAGTRTELTGGNFTPVYSGTLASGGVATATFPIPAGASNYLVMYQGTIGVSGTNALDPVDAGVAIAVSSFAPPARPAAPVLSVGYGMDKLTLTWNSVSGATNYNLKRSTSAGTESTVLSTSATSNIDNGLANGTTYYYVVTAMVNGVESLPSSEVSLAPGIDFNDLVWHSPADLTQHNSAGVATIGTSGQNALVSFYVLTSVQVSDLPSEVGNAGTLTYTGPAVTCTIAINLTPIYDSRESNPGHKPSTDIAISSSANGVLLNPGDPDGDYTGATGTAFEIPEYTFTSAAYSTNITFTVPASTGAVISVAVDGATTYLYSAQGTYNASLSGSYEITPHR